MCCDTPLQVTTMCVWSIVPRRTIMSLRAVVVRMMFLSTVSRRMRPSSLTFTSFPCSIVELMIRASRRLHRVKQTCLSAELRNDAECMAQCSHVTYVNCACGNRASSNGVFRNVHDEHIRCPATRCRNVHRTNDIPDSIDPSISVPHASTLVQSPRDHRHRLNAPRNVVFTIVTPRNSLPFQFDSNLDSLTTTSVRTVVPVSTNGAKVQHFIVIRESRA